MDGPRFLADEMLGSLARWLRMMGYDTEYARDLADSEVLRRAGSEDRIILTRDRQLAERAGDRGTMITSEALEEQLEQVVCAFRLRGEASMTRCTVCNGELERVSRDTIAGKVPERVLELREEFYRCPKCGQLYWKGTHWDNIRIRMERVRARCGSSPR